MLNPAFYDTFLRMFGLSGGHLLILAVVVLLFGSKRLPALGSALGTGINAFKKGMEGKSHQDEIASDEESKKIDDHRRS